VEVDVRILVSHAADEAEEILDDRQLEHAVRGGDLLRDGVAVATQGGLDELEAAGSDVARLEDDLGRGGPIEEGLRVGAGKVAEHALVEAPESVRVGQSGLELRREIGPDGRRRQADRREWDGEIHGGIRLVLLEVAERPTTAAGVDTPAAVDADV